MKTLLLFAALVATPLAAAAPAAPAAPRLPSVQGRPSLATVDGEPVTWAAFRDALASVHEAAASGPMRSKQDPQVLLDRMITAKLIAHEARTIGLDQDKRFRQAVDVFRRETLERLLLERQARKVTAPDPSDVDRFLRATAGVATIDSALLPAEADAQALAEAGGRFADAAREAAAAGKGKADAGIEVKLSEMQVEVAGALAGMKPGQISPPIAVPEGWTVVRLVRLDVPADAAARQAAEQKALEWKRLQTVGTYATELRKRYARIDEPLFASLDFEAATPGIDGFAKDTRAVATIQGAPPITVADLAAELKKKFFHGADRAAQKNRVNVRKQGALDDLLVRRLTVLEGTRTGVAKTPEYLDAVRDHEEGLLFSAFVAKVIAPDVKIGEDEVKARYDADRSQYTSPEMLRLDSIAFATRAGAEEALHKVRDGADFGWLKQNAGGRAPATAGSMSLNGGVFVVSDVDPGLKRALASPKEGDARLFAPEGGAAYVILIREVIPAKTKAFAEVEAEVAGQLRADKTKRVLDDWSSKLRAAYEVKTFVTPAQLDALVRKELGIKA